MDANQMFIDEITNATGITRERLVTAYRESGCETIEELRVLYMDKFTLSYGYANTLAEIIMEDEIE